jgi:hypothetical protein
MMAMSRSCVAVVHPFTTPRGCHRTWTKAWSKGSSASVVSACCLPSASSTTSIYTASNQCHSDCI